MESYHPSEHLCTKLSPLVENKTSERLVMLEGITRQEFLLEFGSSAIFEGKVYRGKKKRA